MIRTRLALALAPCLFALTLAVGCKGKVDQCNAFIDRANQAQTVIARLTLDSDDANLLDGEADKVDAEAKAVGAVELKDAKLAKLRADYVANLGALGRNVRALSKLHAAAKADDVTTAGRAKSLEADAMKVEKESTRVVEEINAFCSAP